jgi:hypothetical protein
MEQSEIFSTGFARWEALVRRDKQADTPEQKRERVEYKFANQYTAIGSSKLKAALFLSGDRPPVRQLKKKGNAYGKGKSFMLYQSSSWPKN